MTKNIFKMFLVKLFSIEYIKKYNYRNEFLTTELLTLFYNSIEKVLKYDKKYKL